MNVETTSYLCQSDAFYYQQYSILQGLVDIAINWTIWGSDTSSFNGTECTVEVLSGKVAQDVVGDADDKG